jgi:predicted permease
MLHIRQAFRALFRSPFVTAFAVASLALGIGAASAIVSLHRQLIVRPLPVAEPERLVNLTAPGPRPGVASASIAGGADSIFSAPMYRDLAREQTVFTGLAAHRTITVNLAYRGETVSDQGMLVSGNYFQVLGLQPRLGRLLTPEDDKVRGGHPVVVVSHSYWQRRVGGSPAIIGDTVVVNGKPFTIIGVTPEGFEGTTLGRWAQIFVPIAMRERVMHDAGSPDDRRNYWAYLFARLKPGVSLEQAETAINVPFRAIITNVELTLQTGIPDQALAQVKAMRIALKNGAHGQSLIRTQMQMPFAVLVGLTGFVLLIACANITNLLLARAASRTSEMALRSSLGASPWQLFAQPLVESCLLGLLGGATGILVAFATARLFRSFLSGGRGANLFYLDPWVVAVAIALSLGSGVLVAVFLSLHGIRPDLATGINAQSTRFVGSRASPRFLQVLVIGQMVLSVMLLVAAGLFVKSLANITRARADLGFHPGKVVMILVAPEQNGYDSGRSAALWDSLAREFAAIPGVQSVSGAWVAVLSGRNANKDVLVEGYPTGKEADRHVVWNRVEPNFFQTLGIPLIAGRDFTRADNVYSPKVAIVNEAFARKFNLGGNAVGKLMSTSSDPGAELDIEIVGVAANAKYNDVKRTAPPEFYLPYRQDDDLGKMTMYVRTAGLPERVVAEVPAIVKRVDAHLPIEKLRTMDQQVDGSFYVDRIIGTLSAAFALLATFLAATGVYGVLAYAVAQRTREIGLRIALGADPTMIRQLVLRQVARMAITGIVVGFVAALALAFVTRSLLFRVEFYDPTVFGGAFVILSLVAVAAGVVPARRAARIDPIRALCYE